MDNVAAARRLARPVAPGVGAMMIWYLVALSGTGPAFRLLRWLDAPRTAAMAVALSVFVVSTILCHRAYAEARRNLAADPGLGGGWVVHNAWWMLLVPFLCAALIGLVFLAVLFA